MSELRKKVAYSSGSGAVQFVAGTGYMLSLAALLGPEDFGKIAFQLSLIALCKAVTISAFQDAIVREDLLTRDAFRRYYLWSASVGALAMVLSLAFFVVFSHGGWELMLVGCFAILANSLIAVPSGLLVKIGDFRRLFFSDLFSFLVAYIFVGVPLIAYYDGMKVLAIPLALAPTVKFFSLVHLVSPKDLSNEECGSKVHFRDFCKTSVSRVLHVSSGHFDKILIGWILGPTALGLYRLAYQFATIPTVLIARTVEKLLISELGNLVKSEKIRVTRYMIFWVLLYSSLVITLMIALYFARGEFAGSILPPEWVPAFSSFLFLMPLLITKPILKLIEVSLRTRHSERDYLFFCIVQLVLISCFSAIGGLWGILFVSALISLAYLIITLLGFALLHHSGTIGFHT